MSGKFDQEPAGGSSSGDAPFIDTRKGEWVLALLVAVGKGRAVSARAAIKGGFVTHLATSSSIAGELLVR